MGVNSVELEVLTERGEQWCCKPCMTSVRLQRSDESPLPASRVGTSASRRAGAKTSQTAPKCPLSPGMSCGTCGAVCANDFICCMGGCHQHFHRTCVALTKVEFEMVSNKNNICYVCDDCRKRTDLGATRSSDLRGCFEELKEDLKTFVRDLVKDLESSLLSSCSSAIESRIHSLYDSCGFSSGAVTPNHPVTSYASVLQNKSHAGVIVKPKSKQENVVTKTELRAKVDPVVNNLQIAKIKNVKDGAVLISCRRNEDNSKLKQLVEESLAETYEIKEVRGVRPRIRIGGITEDLSGEEFLEILKKMNSHLIDSNAECSVLKLHKSRKNSNIYQALIQTDRKSYDSIMKSGYVFVGYNYCPVFDAVEVVRCFNCCQYNHHASRCTNEVCCPRCSGKHKVSECKAGEESLRCCNCARSNSATGSSLNVTHAAWDSRCETFRKACGSVRDGLLLSR